MVLYACHMRLWPAVSFFFMLSYPPSITSGFSNVSVVGMVVLVVRDIKFWTGLINPLLSVVLRHSSKDICDLVWPSLLDSLQF